LNLSPRHEKRLEQEQLPVVSGPASALDEINPGEQIRVMARDHYVPRTYLRHFTGEYLKGERGGELNVYDLFRFRPRRASINRHVASEENFYANHAIDKRWQADETQWPSVIEAIKADNLSPDSILSLLRFAAIQVGRVPASMEKIARTLAYRNAKRFPLPGQPGKIGMVMDMVPTAELLDHVQGAILEGIEWFQYFTTWTCYRNQTSEPFLTSDNPCVTINNPSSVYFPLALDLALVGEADGRRLREPDLQYRQATNAMVRKINVQIVRSADDYIYSSLASDDLTRFLKKQRKGVDRMETFGRTFAPQPDVTDEKKFLEMCRFVNETREKDGRPSV
jgi:hypothetical protein